MAEVYGESLTSLTPKGVSGVLALAFRTTALFTFGAASGRGRCISPNGEQLRGFTFRRGEDVAEGFLIFREGREGEEIFILEGNRALQGAAESGALLGN